MLPFFINTITNTTIKEHSAITANTADQEEQPLRKLNLLGGHTLLLEEEDLVDTLEEPRAILTMY